MSDHEWYAANRALWDERVPIHVRGGFYDVDSFVTDPTRTALPDFVLAEVGDVDGLDLVHVQCHFGLETLSWARRGARTVGVDFSAPAVDAARTLAARTEINAEFVVANVYEAQKALAGRKFDVVYTGLGAINWLPDIDRWAVVMASLLRPGGFLYLAEFHPFSNVFADDDLTVAYPYFHDEPMEWDEPGSYADLDALTTHNRSFEWNHGLGSVVSALIAAGLRLAFLHEHDYTLFPRWPLLETHADGGYHLPPGTPTLPLMYSLRARSEVAPRAGA